MSKITQFTVGQQGLEGISNEVLGEVVTALQKEGYLTQEQTIEIFDNYVVMCSGRHFTSRMTDWLFKKRTGAFDDYRFKLVKVIKTDFNLKDEADKKDETKL